MALPVEMTGKANLPRESFDHPQLPRLWARARVDALLEKIERDGEDQATIDEIIRLARQYKFVTPYTSFLAVPRALLRPRVIRPGDPDSARQDRRVHRLRRCAVSVRAGAAAALSLGGRYLADALSRAHRHAGRHLHRAPHPARPLGHTYRESKTFVIASKPPVVQVKLDRKRFQRGADDRPESQRLREHAHAGRAPGRRGAGCAAVGCRRLPPTLAQLIIPEQTIPGTYKLTVTAEDIAHNIGTQEVQIEVLP